MRFVDLSEEETTLIEQVVLAYGGDVPPRPGPVPAQSNEVGTKLQQRILIADDDPTIRHLISVIAQREGFLVVAARDGREALNAMKGDSGFTAVIFDMMMPYVNGLDLVRFMRADEKLAKIPAGIITAEHDPKLWEDSIAAGAGIFLPKPFTTDQMRYMLRVLTLQGGAGEA
jgi:CheY-like chemotaxis protein